MIASLLTLLYLFPFHCIASHCKLASWFAILYSCLVCHNHSAARSCVSRFVQVLEASFWRLDPGKADTMYRVMATGLLFEAYGSRHHVRRCIDLGYNVMASGVLFHNGRRNHVRRCVDLGAAATRYNVMASSDLFHNGSRHHVRHHGDLGAAATMYNVMANGDLFHNVSMHHVPPHVDLGAAATMYNVMASGDLELN